MPATPRRISASTSTATAGGTPRQVPAGWQEWYGSVDPTTYDFRNYCLYENGTLRVYGDASLARACPDAERGPQAYQVDLYTAKAVDYIGRRAPATQPFFLSVAYVAPHSGGPNATNTRCKNSAQPAPRHRGRFAGAPLPHPPGFNERDVRDKPDFISRLPRLTSERVDAIRTNYQCRRESPLAVDEGVERIVDALRAAGELDSTLFVFTSDNGFFHGEHRVPGGKTKVYEPSVHVPALMRGPGAPTNTRIATAHGKRRPGRHDRRRDRRRPWP